MDGNPTSTSSEAHPLAADGLAGALDYADVLITLENGSSA